MKPKYLFSVILSAALMFAGCRQVEMTGSFDNIKLDKTYLSIPQEGGEATVTITATEAWEIVTTYMDRGDEKPVADWLTIDKTNGTEGETVVKFTAGKAESGREAEYTIIAGANKQFLRIRQGSMDPVSMTSKQILEEAVVGGTYLTKGVVTQLGNYASYGAFWVNDGTSEEDVQVYGSTDESIEDYPDVEVGDSVEFSGVWSSYGNFEDVVITRHVKALLKVITEPQTVAKAASTLEVKLAYKGNGVFTSIPEEYASWISLKDMEYKKGEPSKLESNPADTAIVTFAIAANEGLEREGSIKFSSHKGDDKTEMTYTFSQAGPSFIFTEASAVTSGKKYLMVVDGGAFTLPDSGTYGYAENTPVTVSEDGKTIELFNDDLAFTFTAKDTGYTIQAASGDYLYMTGTFDSFNWSSNPIEGDVWTVEAQADGTFKITNVSKSKWIQLSSKHGTYGSYADESGDMPKLYELTSEE